MSDMHEDATGPAIAPEIAEVQGLFPSNEALEAAIDRLTAEGFDLADLSLPEAILPMSHATPEQSAADPLTRTDRTQLRVLGTSMAGSIGMAAAAGIVAMSGGALAPAAVVGVAVGLGTGLLTDRAGVAVSDTARAAREQAAREGRLVLAARIAAPDQETKAEAAMKAAGATKTAAVTRTTAAIDSARWTG